MALQPPKLNLWITGLPVDDGVHDQPATATLGAMWLTSVDTGGPESYSHAARLSDPLAACGAPVWRQARERWPTGREAPVCGACAVVLWVLTCNSPG